MDALFEFPASVTMKNRVREAMLPGYYEVTDSVWTTNPQYKGSTFNSKSSPTKENSKRKITMDELFKDVITTTPLSIKRHDSDLKFFVQSVSPPQARLDQFSANKSIEKPTVSKIRKNPVDDLISYSFIKRKEQENGVNSKGMTRILRKSSAARDETVTRLETEISREMNRSNNDRELSADPVRVDTLPDINLISSKPITFLNRRVKVQKLRNPSRDQNSKIAKPGFLFSSMMTEDPSSQKVPERVTKFLNFLDSSIAGHNLPQLHKEEAKAHKFQAYVGRGNYESMIIDALKRRWWWNVCTELPSDEEDTSRVDFKNNKLVSDSTRFQGFQLVWTPLRSKPLFAAMNLGDENKVCEEKCEYSYSEFMESLRNQKPNQGNFEVFKYASNPIGKEIFEDVKKLCSLENLPQCYHQIIKRSNFICELSSRALELNNSAGNVILVESDQIKSAKKKLPMIIDVPDGGALKNSLKGAFGVKSDIIKTPLPPKDTIDIMLNSSSPRAVDFSHRSSFKIAILHNHFEGNENLGDKMHLYFNLRSLYSGTPHISHLNQYSNCLVEKHPMNTFIPLTFVINGINDPEYSNFKKLFDQIESHNAANSSLSPPPSHQLNKHENDKLHTLTARKNMWILKPGEKSNRGKGISVATDSRSIHQFIKFAGGPVIVQKYIENPLLFKARKFDMRMYMLATWINGKVNLYFYELGYVRTSSFEYDLDTNDRLVHLTNEAVQIKVSEFGKFEKGNKVSLKEMAAYIKSVYPEEDLYSKIIPLMKVSREIIRTMQKLPFYQHFPS